MIVCVYWVASVVADCAALWTVACLTPLSMGFSRQEYFSGFLCLSPGDLANPRIKPTSLRSPALAGGFFTTSTTWEAHHLIKRIIMSAFGEGNGTPLQYSCLENPMDGEAWWAAVHGVAKSWTRLSDFPFTFYLHALEKEMATHSSVIAWRIPGMGSLVACRLRGHTESDMTEAT